MVEYDPYLEDEEERKKQGRDLVIYWEKQLSYEDRRHKKFREEAKRTEKIYWDESDKDTVYPILHTVSGIKHSALYSEQPDPIVQQRFPDSQRWDKRLGQFTERALRYTCDEFPIEDTAHRVMDDWQVCGLGQWRLRYEAEIVEVPNPEMDAYMLQMQMYSEAEAAYAQGVLPEPPPIPQKPAPTIEQKQNESAWFEIVPWSCFHWQPCRVWKDCDWVAYDEYLTPAELESRFGVDVENQVKAGHLPGDKEKDGGLKVTEIYYKPTRRIYVICEGLVDPLEVREDGLKLRDFFPSPCPLLSNVRSKWLCPMPDYWFYRHGAKQLNRLWQRRETLAEQLKDCGFYDAALTELGSLEKPADGMFKPVTNLVERIKGRTIEGNAVWFKPIENKAKVLTVLDGQITQEETRIFRQTGITDIVQGMAAEQDETFGATRIKNSWAEIRMASPFDRLKTFMVSSYQMMAEVLLEHFDPQRLMDITGIELSPEEMSVLKDDAFRCYAVDIESELSIGRDQKENAEARGQAMDRVINIGTAAAQLIPGGVWSADFANAAMEFAIRDFPEARALSDALQTLPDTQAQFAQLQQQIAELGQQVQEQAAQLDAAGFELQKRGQADIAKDVADAEKKRAETDKIRTETAQMGAQVVVPPDALIDERSVL